MKPRIFWCLVGVGALIGCAVHSASAMADGPTNMPTIEMIAKGLRRTERAVFAESKQFSLRYARADTREVTATRGSGAWYRADYLLGRDGAAWYVKSKFLDPNEKLGLPTEPTVHLLMNGVSLDWDRYNERVLLSPKDNFNVLAGWWYFENAALNPYRQIIETAGVSYDDAITRSATDTGLRFLRVPLLPDFLIANAARYTIQSTRDTVDGASCWVLEWPGMDRLWVDVEHGFAIRRRLFHWSADGPLARQVDNLEIKEVRPGLWLPTRQVVDSYARPEIESESLWNQIANRATYVVSDIDFSSAPDALTAVRLPVGTMVTDGVRKISYTVTDDEGNPFERPLGQARDLLGRTGSPAGVGVALLIGANAIFAVIAALYYLVRRVKKRGKTLLLILALLPQADARAHERNAERNTRDGRPRVDDKGHWSWKPAWLERNACGPNSLFVLLKLLEKDVTLSQVKDLVKCDPVLGCSMADLSNAASALGAPADVWFVRPDQLEGVPFPYILHGSSGLKEKTGHFTVVVARDAAKRQLASIDPILESFGWNPEAGIMSEYSGYVLVPRRASIATPTFLFALGLTLISSVFIWRRRPKSQRGTTLASRRDC